MRPPADAPQRFVLHVSVAARWWLYHLPQGPEAARFLWERLRLPGTSLVAVEGIELQILEQIATDLGDDLNTFLADTLAGDVLQLFADFEETNHLELVPVRRLARVAMLTVAMHRISFADAVAAALAEDSGAPLLVANEGAYRILKALEPARPALRVAWLPDELDS